MRSICLFVISVSSLHLEAAENFWDEIPVSPSTTIPAKVNDDYWNSEFRRVNEEIAKAEKPQLIFFGDSITWSWSLGPATGKAMWEEKFAAYNPINMGNSGDITPVMLYRVTNGNLDFPEGKHPKVAVILCGINNFGVTQSDGGKEKWDLGIDCPLPDIANGQRAIAQVFRRKLPQTHVIMLGLLPVADPDKWKKCQRVNEIQSSYARNTKEVTFLDLQKHFLQADGTINKSLYSDKVHLTAEGYRVWSAAIEPKIKELMKAPQLDPLKIMLIGGSTTEGPDSKRSYRRYLDGMLRQKGHLIDFVGSQNQHNAGKTKPDSHEFDHDHESYSGKNLAWIAERMPELLEKNLPDLAVISPEQNDTMEGIENIIASLRSKNPNVRIIVTKPLAIKDNKEANLTANPPVILTDISINDKDISEEQAAEKIAEKLSETIHTLIAKDGPEAPAN